LYRITGIDRAQVDGINVLTSQIVIAEDGTDLGTRQGNLVSATPGNAMKKQGG
jgi:hypothetical protein